METEESMVAGAVAGWVDGDVAAITCSAGCVAAFLAAQPTVTDITALRITEVFVQVMRLSVPL
jgi:hypothetical protein